MKTFISIKQFAVLDYLGSIALFVSPWVFGFSHALGSAALIPMYLGGTLLLMTLFTDFRYGIYRAIPLQMHLLILLFMAFFLAVSPWILSFAHIVFLPQLILGLLFMVLAIFTHNSPFLTKPHKALREAGIKSTDANEGRLMI